MYKNQQKTWDEVYQNYKPSELPWYRISFPQEIIEQLNKLDKNKKIIVSGCGTGESVENLWNLGFKDVVGTDISKHAIDTAKKNFTHLNFYCVPTQQLSSKYRNVNTFDWMNLHQISFNDLVDYLSSLEEISDKIILVYIYEPELGKLRESYITKDKVYNHNPKEIVKVLSKMKLIKDISFEFSINTKFSKRIHKAQGLVFNK